MQASSFVELQIEGVSLDTLAEQVTGWVLGRHGFGKLRQRRLRVGIPREVTHEAVLQGGDFLGADDCLVRVRRDEAGIRWLLHFSHRDAQRDDVF